MTWVWSQAPQASISPEPANPRQQSKRKVLMSAALQSSVLQSQMEISTVHLGDLWHSCENYALSRHVQAGRRSFQLARGWHYCFLYILACCQCVWIDSFCVFFASTAIPGLQVAGVSWETYFIILIHNSVWFLPSWTLLSLSAFRLSCVLVEHYGQQNVGSLVLSWIKAVPGL